MGTLSRCAGEGWGEGNTLPTESVCSGLIASRAASRVRRNARGSPSCQSRGVDLKSILYAHQPTLFCATIFRLRQVTFAVAQINFSFGSVLT